MNLDKDMDVFCVTCGTVIHPPDYSLVVRDTTQSWLCKAVLIRASEEISTEAIQEITAVTTGGPYFEDQSHQNYTTCDANSGQTYFPLHPKCLDIAKRVVAYNKSTSVGACSTAGARSLKQLIDIYQSRYTTQILTEQKADEEWFPNCPPLSWLREPLQYHGAMQNRNYWDMKGIPELQQYEACPFPLYHVTEVILSFLRPLAKNVGPSSQIDLLPKEILDLIAEHLRPFANPPLKCSRVMSPLFWRRVLFDRKTLPWLWDLDPAILLTRRWWTAYDDKSAWDWELLVRQLAQVEIFEKGKLMESAPLGLRNRRRIWRLVDEARLDDMYEEEEPLDPDRDAMEWEGAAEYWRNNMPLF